METLPVFVGLDYHSKSVQVCATDQAGTILVNRRVGNSLTEILQAIPSGRPVARAAIESCCGAADLAEALRDGPKWNVTLAHPGYASRIKHNPDKSDYSDARMLAELCRAGLVPPVWLAPEWVRELRMLIRLRADLVGRIRTVKTRILAVLRALRVAEPEKPGRWTRKWHEWLATAPVNTAARFVIDMHLRELTTLRTQVRETETELDKRLKDDAVVKRLLEEPGVGKITAWTMRALIGDFGRFTTGKELARFCAVTPRNASSGQRVADAGLIKAGDALLKTVVIEAAHRLRRHEPRWQALSDRLTKKGKPTSVIVAAVANRWVRWLYHRIKEITQTPEVKVATAA